MNTEIIISSNHEETSIPAIRPCVLCDGRQCGSCKWYDSVTETCSDGTPRSPSGWCKDFAWG